MISVIVPLFNYAKYIADNIESIQQQSYADWELIIVDDASIDKPHRVIRNYADDRIKYIRRKINVGYSAAKNIGIRNSKGEWIVVLDADDMLTSTSLEERLKKLQEDKGLWIHAKAYEFGGEKPYQFVFKKRRAIRRLRMILRSKDFSTLWENIHAQTVMVHRSVYEKVGLYEPSLRSMGDKEMWHRIIRNVCPPLYLNKFVAYYRQHRDQMHRSAEKKAKVKEYLRILNRCNGIRAKGDLSTVERL